MKIRVNTATKKGMFALMVNTDEIWFGFRVWNLVAYLEKS
jgi:hypothetical protein